jgi:hypothetical protein
MKNEMGTAHYTNGEEEKCREDVDAEICRKRPLERHVYRWDNIKLNLGNGMGWCELG